MENYMQDENVRRYYKQWISSPTPLDHPSDKENFYRFVKACVDYAEHKDVRRKLSIDYLNAHLYDDLHSKYSEEAYDNIRHEIIVLFEHLLEYEDTAFPIPY